MSALAVPPPPAIELPPAEATPTSVRPASNRYVADPSHVSRAELVAAVDLAGDRWEQQIAARAIEARAELVECCRRTAELSGELVALHAASRWLRAFPWHCTWEPEPHSLHVDGREVPVTEILAAVEDACAVDPRLTRLAPAWATTRWRSPARSTAGSPTC